MEDRFLFVAFGVVVEHVGVPDRATFFGRVRAVDALGTIVGFVAFAFGSVAEKPHHNLPFCLDLRG